MSYRDADTQRTCQRNWVAKKRAEYFADKSCIRCGSTTKLELDHIDPDTKESHNIWSWSEARRKIELSKCQVLCHDCHEEKSMTDRKQKYLATPIRHGTRNGYVARGCRCRLCVEHMKAVRASWKRGCGVSHRWTTENNPSGVLD